MYKLNLVAIVSTIAAVSLAVGMASPAVAFTDDHNATMSMFE